MEEGQSCVQEQGDHTCKYVDDITTSALKTKRRNAQTVSILLSDCLHLLTSDRSEPAPPITVTADTTERTATAEAPVQTDIDRRLERARALFKKYDFDLDESEWKLDVLKPGKPSERVQKTIRMRVKYTCHSCNTVFGHDKICISCQHPRCAKCIRYPPRKNKAKKQGATTVASTAEKASDNKCACHECQTGFEIGAAECPNCHHKICDRCLKEALVAVSPPPQAAEPEKKPAQPGHSATESVPVAAS